MIDLLERQSGVHDPPAAHDGMATVNANSPSGFHSIRLPHRRRLGHELASCLDTRTGRSAFFAS